MKLKIKKRTGRKYNPKRKICKICNKHLCDLKGRSVDGFPLYKTKCKNCRNSAKKKHNKYIKNRKKVYKLYIKKSYCENCGFKAKHSCQLDVDHIDGNSENNSIENYQTLCANCHRLKTQLNKDWKRNKKKED